MNATTDYIKIDRMVAEANAAPNLAEYLASVWGHLTSHEGKALLKALDAQ